MTHFVIITQVTRQGRPSPYGQQWLASMPDGYGKWYTTKVNQRSPEAALRNLAEMVRGESLWGTFVANGCEPYKTEPRSRIEHRLYEIQIQHRAVAAIQQRSEERFTMALCGIVMALSIIAAFS